MAKQVKNYSESIEDLELIIESIEKGEVSIDELTIKIKQAVEIIENCKMKLQVTEKEISRVLKSNDSI